MESTDGKIANGSGLGGDLKLTGDEIVSEGGMFIDAGSMLSIGSTIAKGTYLTNDIVGEDGTVYKKDTRLSSSVILKENTETKAGQVLAKNSVIKAYSTLAATNAENEYAKLDLSDSILHRLSDANVLEQADAQITIAVAEAALVALSKVRADIGSSQQQLNITKANIQTTIINLNAAESSIRDVDFAAESSNLKRLQILAQAGAYALAQANSSSETVLKLLQ